jgi:energy-coupling factor transporter ATP-binding protein EcfA2
LQFRRVYIKNFQSIKELEIILEENRCYHIKGKNNIGKSNFLKALTAIVKNVPSRSLSSYIRDDEESFYIEISDFDNNVVRLSRGKEDYYSWVINGSSGRIDGTAGKVPDEVRSYFNMYEDTEKTKEIVNIRLPRAKLLFVDNTYAENYYLLQKALRVEEYLSAIKLGGTKKNSLKKEIDVLSSRVVTEKEELSNLKDYSLILKEIQMYEDVADTYYNQITEIVEIKELASKVEEKEIRLKENTFDFDRKAVSEMVDTIKKLKDVCDILNGITTKEKNITNKELVIEEFSKANDSYINLKESLENKKLLDVVSYSSNKVNKLDMDIKTKTSFIQDWEFKNVISNINNIKESVSIISDAKLLREKISQLKKAEEDYETVDKERSDFMLEYKFCPVVLSMKDKKCPFSNKTLEELLV